MPESRPGRPRGSRARPAPARGFTPGPAAAPPRAAPEHAVEPGLEVEVQFADRRPWSPTRAALVHWARAADAAARGRRSGAGALCLRVVGADESRRLNRRYRGKDRPTNVLSFPASPEQRRAAGLLGDLVICAEVVAQEAREQHKARGAHWAHMVVHGVLHLRGLDHEREADARRMERREVAILAAFGYQDPYRRMSHDAA